jgi:Mg2+ and Co2+ transporter CorA
MDCQAVFREKEWCNVKEVPYTRELLDDPDVIWIDIIVETRDKLIEGLGDEKFSPALTMRLLNPGQSFRLERIKPYSLLDCNIGYNFSGEDPNYITFIFAENKLVTISTVHHHLSVQFIPENIVNYMRSNSYHYVALSIFARIVDHNARIAKEETKKVDKVLKASINNILSEDIVEIEKLYNKVIDITEIFQDQLTTVRLLPIADEASSKVGVFLIRIEKSMDHLVNSMERSIDKLDYIFQRHRILLQEKGNARLNTLTIIQSIFVPLTFIAGIYGMNFTRMPELQSQYGYFITLGVMLSIGIGGLILFYRNGWFNSD